MILGGVSDSWSGIPRASSSLMISLWRVAVIRIDERVSERERSSLICSEIRSVPAVQFLDVVAVGDIEEHQHRDKQHVGILRRTSARVRMLPDSTCATLRSTHDGRFGRGGFPRRRKHCPVPEAGISDACPRPCDAMPDAPETPEVPEVLGTHPSAAAASCHSSDTLCLLFSLIADGGIRRQKYTIFRYESPLRHISGVVSLHASPPARTSLFSRRCPFLFRVRRRSFTLISCPFLPVFPIC